MALVTIRARAGMDVTTLAAPYGPHRRQDLQAIVPFSILFTRSLGESEEVSIMI